MSSEGKTPVHIGNPWGPMREVDFFLRIHRHLPDDVCYGEPLGPCQYSPLRDKEPINAANESLVEKRRDPEFLKLEKIVETAQHGLTCPYCGQPAEWTSNENIYGKKYGKSYMVYLCKPCDAYVHCHQNSRRPLGTMANRVTRKWRKQAHLSIDPLWKRYYGSRRNRMRNRVYDRLSEIFGEEVHIGESDVNRCRAIIAAVKNGKLTNLNY